MIVSRGGTHLATVFPRLEKTITEDVDGDGEVTQIEADDPEARLASFSVSAEEGASCPGEQDAEGPPHTHSPPLLPPPPPARQVYFSVGGRPLTPFRRFALVERREREAATEARDKAE